MMGLSGASWEEVVSGVYGSRDEWIGVILGMLEVCEVSWCTAITEYRPPD